jgi:hypothetical protein
VLGRKIVSLAIVVIAALFHLDSAAGGDLAHLGAKVGGPLGVAATGGFAFAPDAAPLLVEVEAGSGGGKIGVGVIGLFTSGSSGGNEPWLGLFHTLTLRAVAVRTWGSPIGVEAGRTLVGGEVEYALLYFLTLHGGVLYPVDGTSERQPVATFGVGVHLWPFLGR